MSNPYVKFINLLPKQVRYIGKIVSISTNGSVEIMKVNAVSKSIVIGGTDSYSVNDYVLVVNGVINSKLPPLQEILEESVI